MKLLHNTTSPYVRKCWAILEMTGLIGRCELVHASGTPLAPDPTSTGANPLGKVPVLETDDGRRLYDSRVITRYLDGVAGAGLYPEGEAVWDVLTLEALADGILDAAVLVVYESRLRPEELRFEPWVEGQQAKIDRGVAMLEARAGELEGPVRASHIAAGVALEYVDFRLKTGWREAAPALAKWQAGFAEEPWMKATAPRG